MNVMASLVVFAYVFISYQLSVMICREHKNKRGERG